MENLLALQTLFTVDCKDTYVLQKEAINPSSRKMWYFPHPADRETEIQRVQSVLEDEDNDSQDWSVLVAKYQSASIKLTL